MAQRAYADAARPPEERSAVLLLKYLRKHRITRFNARDARRDWGLPNLSQAADMTAALEVLIDADCIQKREPEASGPGRKRLDYIVNPCIIGGA
jgi:hypothetical protein